MKKSSKIMLASSTSCSSDTNLENIKQHIVDFFDWLNIFTMQQNYTVNSTRKEKCELLFLLLQLKKQLSHSISLLKAPYVTERYEFICQICSGEIILEPGEDIWECLENHSHLKSCVNVGSPLQCKEELANNALLNCPYESSHKELNFMGKLFHNIRPALQYDPVINLKGRFVGSVDTKEHEGSKLTLNDSMPTDSTVSIDLKKNHFCKNELNSNFKSEKLNSASPDMLSRDLNVSSSSCINDQKQTEELPILKSRTWYPTNLLTKFEQSKEDSIVEPQSPKIKDLDKNNFRFNFKTKYSTNVESYVYPHLYHRFDLDGDPILQKTGSERTVCLTCSCELLNQKTASNIMSHMSGTKHVNKAENPFTKSFIKNYHDTFLRLDREYQSHQIYFAADDESLLLKCVVCVKYVRSCDVMAHILDKVHTSKLIQMSVDNKMHSLFHFLESHVKVHGVFRPVAKNTNASDQKEKPKGTNVKEHNIVKSIDKFDPASKIKLPARFSQHMKYLQPAGNLVFCTICDKDKNIFRQEDTRLHLVQPSHLVKSKVQMNNYLYHCEVCDKRVHDEITWIIHFEDEKKRHQEAGECKPTDKPFEYECLTCKFVLFGDSEAVQKHRNSNPTRRNERNKATALNKEVKQYFSTKAVIREHGNKLLDDAQSAISNTDVVLKCLNDLENALKSKYSSCKAYPFGSRISGLGDSHSDLDIFIDIGSMYSGEQNQDADNQTKIITNVMSLIKKRKEFHQKNCIPTARTPIIQLKHRPTDLECDISFVHGLSVENTKFIRYCFEMQPIAQKLILLVKKWSHLCGLNENISTYALAMLGIFYLQKNNYLLSVQTMKELNRINVTIVGWETIDYVTPKAEIVKHIDTFDGDIIELLTGFFKFYSDFNYKLNIVCPLLGTEISKGLFTIDLKGSALPKEMASYFIKVNTEKSPEYFRCLSSFCIQDPFDLSHNLTKACSSSFLDKFVKLCTLTHAMLSKLTD